MASTRNAKLTRIQRREKLEKLFDKGRYVYFTATDDGDAIIHTKEESDPKDMRVWVRPPSPLQREMVVREAQAARARAVVNARDPDSQDWITIRGFIASLTMDGLVDYVLDLDEQERLQESRREVLKDKQWEDFNALRDTMRQYEDAGSPIGDPEWEPFLARDREFGKQVIAGADELRDTAREAMKLMPRERLESRAFEKRIEQVGTTAFMHDYEGWMLFYACRDEEDHSELYFVDWQDLKSQPDELQTALGEMLASFVTEAGEAKNSQGAASGSDSSALPDEPEISESSTPEESSE